MSSTFGVVVEDMDAELGWIAVVIQRAKRHLERDKQLIPTVMGLSPTEGMVMMPIIGAPEPESLRRVIRSVTTRFAVTEVAIIMDTFAHTGSPEAMDAMARDVRAWRSWSPEYKRQVNYRRREAINCHVERDGKPTRQVWQFYRREGDAIVWEECANLVTDPERGDFIAGPVTGLLGSGGEAREDLWELAQAVTRHMAALGYVATQEGQDVVVLLRPDGTVFSRISRGNHVNFDRWTAMLRGAGVLRSDG